MIDETQYALDEGLSASPFDANGNATLTTGPTRYGERWHVNRYQTFCSGFGCQLVMYKNHIGDPYVIDSTLTAEAATGGIEFDLECNEQVIFAWSQGTVGDVVSYHLIGTRYVRGDRAYGGRRLS